MATDDTKQDAHEESQLRCWQENAQAWSKAVSNGEIRSRVEVTNQAILQTIKALNPKTLVDIGCGEGWLTEALTQQGIHCLGIDGTEALISTAKATRAGEYQVLTYQEMADTAPESSFAVGVCNFSLLGQASTEQVFSSLHAWIKPGGHLVIQTLDPANLVSEINGQEETWLPGSWDGFSEDFVNPVSWYFRSIKAWKQLFIRHNIELLQIESQALADGSSASIILIGQVPHEDTNKK